MCLFSIPTRLGSASIFAFIRTRFLPFAFAAAHFICSGIIQVQVREVFFHQPSLGYDFNIAV